MAFSEQEAFAHAGELYRDWITRNTPPPSAEIVSELETKVFRPDVELQLAGLSILGAQEFAEPTHLVLSLACFTIDHLLWGWFAAVNFHPRIAFSLSRSALEASIFGIAAATDYSTFKSIWNSRHGTGGTVLKEMKNLPKDLRWFLNSSWKMMAELGHASSGPVLSSLTMFSDGEQVKRGITFAGQFGGSLDGRQLDNCVNAFCIAATAGTEAMNIGLRPSFTQSTEWCRRFEEFQRQLDTEGPLPAYLAEYVDEFRKYFGRKPPRDESVSKL
ncbi:MAG: hypothetical protein FJ240_11060 [Nitrospira sp.]|nr:hypothetical protein [Nitrospira sp.]